MATTNDVPTPRKWKRTWVIDEMIGQLHVTSAKFSYESIADLQYIGMEYQFTCGQFTCNVANYPRSNGEPSYVVIWTQCTRNRITESLDYTCLPEDLQTLLHVRKFTIPHNESVSMYDMITQMYDDERIIRL